MKNKPEDRPKVIALGIGIAAIFAYVLFSLVPRIITAQNNNMAAEKAAAQNPTNNVPAPSVPAGGVPTSGTPNAKPISAVEDPNKYYEAGASQVTASGRKDPFTAPTPIKNPNQPEPRPTPTPQAPPKPSGSIQQASRNTVQPGVQSLPGMGNQPALVQGGGVIQPQLYVAPAPPPPPPPIELKGVITGEPPVAVVYVNGEMLHKQKGDLLAEGLKITRISEEGIVISYYEKSYAIAVGRTLNTQAKPRFNISSLISPDSSGKR